MFSNICHVLATKSERFGGRHLGYGLVLLMLHLRIEKILKRGRIGI
jgi:hypothetical protein